jgi:hypothetical protein
VFGIWKYRKGKVAKCDLGQGPVEFSIARYEPMARLMSQDDLLFLQSQPGFRPEIGKKFTKDRRRIFRQYLEELARDFHRLHAEARAVVASLPAENASLVGALMRAKFRFWYEMAAIEARLSLQWAGVESLDVRGLLNVLGSMQIEINRLAAPSLA